jgi:ferrochelatase
MTPPLLLVSYGAPERCEEVIPFLNNLFAGKNVSAERVAAAVQKYERFAAATGRYSPLNAECRKLIEGIGQLHPDMPIYWGNLFWHPLLVDTIAAMAQDGVERAVCFATSAFDSPSGNKRYADALESARQAVGAKAPILEKLPLPFDHPLFIEAQTDRLHETLAWHLAGTPVPPEDSIILFSAHSIPLADAAQSHYVEQLQSTCRRVMEKSGTSIPWELVFQSRSGATAHWLAPDIKERISELIAEGRTKSVIVSPIGFFCENMETEYDLDVEVGGYCAQLSLAFFRSKAVGAVSKICRLIVELAGNV